MKRARSLLSISVAVAMIFSLAACGQTPQSSGSGTQAESSAAPAETKTASETTSAEGAYPKIDWEPKTSLSVGMNGEAAANLSDFTFTDEERDTLAKGGFTAVISYHQLADQCNTVKAKAAKEALESLGIKVLSVTEAQLNPQTQISQVESAGALKPSVLLVNPFDPESISAPLKKLASAGTKIVFMENVAKDFVAGEDYVACVSSDAYGNGFSAAMMLAEKIGYKGKVAEVFYDAKFFVTNERDRGFEDAMKKYYPDITVIKSPYTDQTKVGTNGDALMAQHPDLKGAYVSWEAPAEYIMASAKAVGKKDLTIVTIDLGDTSARSIANDGMIKCSATSRSYDQGKCEAYAAAYALLGKKVPSTYVTPVALPVDFHNLIEGYCASYGLDKAPDWLVEDYEKAKNSK